MEPKCLIQGLLLSALLVQLVRSTLLSHGVFRLRKADGTTSDVNFVVADKLISTIASGEEDVDRLMKMVREKHWRYEKGQSHGIDDGTYYTALSKFVVAFRIPRAGKVVEVPGVGVVGFAGDNQIVTDFKNRLKSPDFDPDISPKELAQMVETAIGEREGLAVISTSRGREVIAGCAPKGRGYLGCRGPQRRNTVRDPIPGKLNAYGLGADIALHRLSEYRTGELTVDSIQTVFDDLKTVFSAVYQEELAKLGIHNLLVSESFSVAFVDSDGQVVIRSHDQEATAELQEARSSRKNMRTIRQQLGLEGEHKSAALKKLLRDAALMATGFAAGEVIRHIPLPAQPPPPQQPPQNPNAPEEEPEQPHPLPSDPEETPEQPHPLPSAPEEEPEESEGPSTRNDPPHRTLDPNAPTEKKKIPRQKEPPLGKSGDDDSGGGNEGGGAGNEGGGAGNEGGGGGNEGGGAGNEGGGGGNERGRGGNEVGGAGNEGGGAGNEGGRGGNEGGGAGNEGGGGGNEVGGGGGNEGGGGGNEGGGGGNEGGGGGNEGGGGNKGGGAGNEGGGGGDGESEGFLEGFKMVFRKVKQGGQYALKKIGEGAEAVSNQAKYVFTKVEEGGAYALEKIGEGVGAVSNQAKYVFTKAEEGGVYALQELEGGAGWAFTKVAAGGSYVLSVIELTADALWEELLLVVEDVGGFEIIALLLGFFFV